MTSRRSLLLAALACLLASGGCAHRKTIANTASLKEANDTLFRFLRWGPDLRSASQMVVADSRKAWLDKALDAKEDEDLKITESENDDLRMEGEGEATTEVKVTWHRLPSVTTKTDRVKVTWIDKSGVWFVLAIDGGPLPLAAIPQVDPVDGGVAAKPAP